MASEVKLPTRQQEILQRHDLLVDSGIYRAEIRQSINTIFVLVASSGDVIVHQIPPLELELHRGRAYQEMYDAWRTIEPVQKPTLMRDAAPRGMSARTRRLLLEMGYQFAG